MLYSEMIRRAAVIAHEAHLHDTDKGGYPYLLHPLHLAEQMDGEAAVCTALLHDVVEDHGDRYDFPYLAAQGFPAQVLDALRLLTHDNALTYQDYIRRIAGNAIARQVKLADLRHNLDASRTGGVRPPKQALYEWALGYLEEKNACL